jgi:hypothetical protein
LPAIRQWDVERKKTEAIRQLKGKETQTRSDKEIKKNEFLFSTASRPNE